MEQIIVTHLDNTTLKLQSRANSSSILSAIQSVELLGNDTVSISVESASKLLFNIGDKITIIGRDYTLNQPPKETKKGERSFVYDLQFEGVQYDLLRANYSVNVDTTSNEIQDLSGDSLTGDLKRFLDVLISNANRVFPDMWVLGDYPEETETKTLTFGDSDNCLSVLQSLCSESNFNTEFKIDIDEEGVRTINIGVTGQIFPFTFQHGKSKGIFELNRQKVSSTNIVTRLNVYGSSKNINTSKYRSFKLCLPTKNKAQSFLESSAAITKYGVWEQTKNFDDIFPHRTGTVSSLGSTQLKFVDSSMDFDLNAKDGDGNTLYLIPGTVAKIHFNSGNLAGFEFDISAYSHSTKEFTIKPFTDENGYTFPSPTSAAFQCAIGDKYVITDIYMPQSYIDTAEANLQTAGQAYLDKNCQPRVSYGLTVNSFFLKNIVGAEAESNIIWVGDYIPVKDTDIEIDKSIRVKSFTRDLLKDYSYNLTIADLTVTVNTITRMISELNGIEKIVKMNSLNNPAQARKNYLDAQEVYDMIFDTEGNIYSDKIAPLSIDTTMLKVGAKYMQFGLTGTIFQVNFGGVKNRIVYAGGILTHYAILDGTSPRSWTIADGDITLTSDAAYYVYAKCDKTGTGGVMYFSTSQIMVESDGSYYHFLIGILNSVGPNDERALALMYGFTTINGRFIKTGRVQSADGFTYFDLDAGEIGGKINFKDGLISDLIELGDGETVLSGLQGNKDINLAAWFGGTYEDAISNLAKIVLNKDGSGHLAGGKINWDAAGSMNVGLFNIFSNLLSSGNISMTSDALEDIADIPGSTSYTTPPSTALADYANKSDINTSANFTLSKNSNVKFRINQHIVAFASDYASCHVKIYDSSNNLIQSINKSKSVATGSTGLYDYSINLQAGTYYMVLDVAMNITDPDNFQEVSIIGYAGSGSNISIEPISALTKLANNGFYSYWGASAYLYLRTNYGFQVMFGNYGIQCTTAGLKKTSNGGTSWASI